MRNVWEHLPEQFPCGIHCPIDELNELHVDEGDPA